MGDIGLPRDRRPSPEPTRIKKVYYHCFSHSKEQKDCDYTYQFKEEDREYAIYMANRISPDFTEVFIIEGTEIEITKVKENGKKSS